VKASIEIFRALGDLTRAAAGKIVGFLAEAIDTRGVATIALSGGTTPRGIYGQLGSDDFVRRVDWTKVHFFWGDERCVPPASSESNYRLVKESLLAQVVIPDKNVHRIMTEKEPREAALGYEQAMERFFSLSEDQFPAFDLVLLGLGEDGHTASLFPSNPMVNERSRLAVEVFVNKLAQYRITMTLSVINNARAVLFVVSGKHKASIVREVLAGDTISYPAQMVRPVSGELYWFLDQDAASQLHPEVH
jgi:6-phosphogluconolactonase